MTRWVQSEPLPGSNPPSMAQAGGRRQGETADREGAPLKIGIVSPYGYPLPGGVNEHVRYTYEAMRRMGHDAWIITSAYGLRQPDEGHVIRIGYGLAVPANGSIGRVTLSLGLPRKTRAVLEEHRFDVLHFHEPFVPFLSPAMLEASDTVNIGTFHAFGGFSPSYWLGSKVVGGLAERLHGRIAVSGAARHFINRYFPADYRIIPNGVDLERFANAEPYEELRDGMLNILFVGRHEDRKGFEYLLKAYHRLRKRHVDARLLVCGAGPLLRQHRRYAATRRIRDVEFLGRVSDEQKARYFASADIFCAPSTGQESFGIVLLEAMAAGVPIVASDIHGYKNVLQRSVQGLLVEPRNPRALAAALYALAQDADLRHSMGEAGRERAPEFSWDRVTERTVAFYREVREQVARRA
jgi:phosphatidyl-myo-inositol alpha-mannosyltransferase